MPDSSALVSNERLKVVSSTLMRLGSVLLAAAVAKVYLDGRLGLVTGSWIVVAGVLFAAGWIVLGALTKED